MTNGEDAVDNLAQDAVKLGADFAKFATSTGAQMIEAAKDFVDCTIDQINNVIINSTQEAIHLFTSLTGLDSLNDLMQATNTVSGEFQSILSANSQAKTTTESFISDFTSYYNNQVKPNHPNAPPPDSANEELANITAAILFLPQGIQIANQALQDFVEQSGLNKTASDTNEKVNEAKQNLNSSLSYVTDQVSYLDLYTGCFLMSTPGFLNNSTFTSGKQRQEGRGWCDRWTAQPHQYREWIHRQRYYSNPGCPYFL